MPVDPGLLGSEAAWSSDRESEAPCPRCLVEGSPLHLCLAATRYAEPLPWLLPAFKNPTGPLGPRTSVWRIVDHLVDHLAHELIDRIRGEHRIVPSRVVSIPLHPSRLRRRGFNHADLIAHRLAVRLGCPFEPSLISRIRDTGSQAGLAAQDRRTNLRGAFRARRLPPSQTAPRIFLVDDVLTTGSTLDAAADSLLAAGVGEVWGLVVSATVAGPARRTRRAARPRA